VNVDQADMRLLIAVAFACVVVVLAGPEAEADHECGHRRYSRDTGEVEYRTHAGLALHGLSIQQSSLDGEAIYWSCLQQGLPMPGLP